MHRLLGLLTLFCALLVSGCAHYSAYVRPETKVSEIKKIFVENNLSDNRHIEVMIVNSLKAQGIDAESGPPTMIPDEVDAILRYADTWTWDFSDHLIALEIEMIDGKRQKPIGMARYTGPAAMTTSAPEVVDRLIRDLLGKTKAKR